MKKQEWIDLGEQKYDAFVEKLGYGGIVMTPHTATLETLGGLKPGSDSFIRVAILEFARNL